MEEEEKNLRMPVIAKSVDKFLKEIEKTRKTKKISQKEMGEKLGITQAAYGRIESGQTDLKVITMFQIMELLGMKFSKEQENEFIPTTELQNLATKNDLSEIKEQNRKILEILSKLNLKPESNEPGHTNTED